MTLEEVMKVAEALGLGPDATLEDFLAKIDAMKKGEGDKPKPKEGEDAPAEQAEMAAAARQAIALTGKASPAEAMAELSRRSKVAIDLEQRETQLAADRATLEASERRKLVGELVKLGVEIPATAWADDKGTVPAAEYQAMPIERLRDKVAKLTTARGGSRTPVVTPPPGGAAGGLSENELAKCRARGVDPDAYLRTKQALAGRTVRNVHPQQEN